MRHESARTLNICVWRDFKRTVSRSPFAFRLNADPSPPTRPSYRFDFGQIYFIVCRKRQREKEKRSSSCLSVSIFVLNILLVSICCYFMDVLRFYTSVTTCLYFWITLMHCAHESDPERRYNWYTFISDGKNTSSRNIRKEGNKFNITLGNVY